MIRLAYERLSKDPAWQDQKELFPTRDGILGWEGVAVKSVPQVVISGGQWVDPKRGGPDADGKTRDSLHYYNPNTNKGGAPTEVEDCYNKLLLQMYNQGNFGRSEPDDDTNHYASWSAHYLADMSVPYHTTGIPNAELKNILSTKEAGPDYLWEPGGATLNAKGDDIIPDSIEKPKEWWGLNGDFSDEVSYFKVVRGTNDLKDWFDPWYYNGTGIGLGETSVIGSASHGSWEAWAHKYIVKNNLAVSPAAYSKEWKNATPKLGLAIDNLENQAAQAKAFTADAALKTSNYMAIYTKAPEGGFNKAVERMATLWRASLTALRPAIQVAPDSANPKLLRVVATIQSVEPVDPARNVQAKLTADGGKVRGSDTQTVKGDVKPGQPGLLSWEVDAADPDSCKLRLEVIGNYANTPDLQYAVVEPGKDRISVEVSHNQVRAGDKVKLTIKVQPAAKTELTVTNWGPLEKKFDLLSFWKKGELTTDGSGIYSGQFTVSKTTRDGSYDIKVANSKNKAAGSAKIYVGLNIRNCKGVYIRFLNNVRVASSASGSGVKAIMGDNPQTTITSWEGDYTVNTTMVTANPNETGTLKITLDDKYETITSFTWNYKYQDNAAKPGYMKSATTTIIGGGLKKGMIDSPFGNYTPDFYYKLTGEAVCSNIKVKETIVNFDGTTKVLTSVICNTDTSCDILFQR
jgi:hypothetical protein